LQSSRKLQVTIFDLEVVNDPGVRVKQQGIPPIKGLYATRRLLLGTGSRAVIKLHPRVQVLVLEPGAWTLAQVTVLALPYQFGR